MPKGKQGFQKGHPVFNTKGGYKKGHIPWSKLNPELMKPNSGSFKKGQIPWNKGKKMSVEYRNKLSEAHIGKQMAYKHPNWKGGKNKRYDGYILVYCPNHPSIRSKKYVFEHRLVMEKHLGRYLTHKEVVHHINNIKNDNRIENLMLFPNESKHQFYHSKLKLNIQ